MIPYGRQDVREEDILSVMEVLRSDFITQGPTVPAFERNVAIKVGAEHAVAVNSGTSALHTACMAMGLGPGDRLWTSPITFVASANCGLYCGAEVDFVDIDPETYNMSIDDLEERLVDADRRAELPSVIIPVHMCGQPCDMKEIHGLSESYGYKIIEDACHAIGAEYRGKPTGICEYSDITVFSFHPVKIITTAEGGMAVTNDALLHKRMNLIRNHGITRDESDMVDVSEGPWFYQQVALGFNYRMTDIQAALGLSQLTRLEEYVQARNNIARGYDESLRNLPMHTPTVHQDRTSSYHLYVIRIDSESGYERDILFNELRERGVGVNVHYIPVHTQPWYRQLGFKRGDFPEAERYYSEAISLPMFPTMSVEQQEHVIESLREVLG